MKQTFKRLALFAGIALVGVMLFGCKTTKITEAPTTAPTSAPTSAPTTAPTSAPTEKADLNLLEGFDASEAGVYDEVEDSASSLHFTYAKGEKPGAYLKKTVSGLAGFNSLAITVKKSGNFKIELYAGEDSISIGIQSAAEVDSVVDWNLRNDQAVLAEVTEVRIYAAPGKEVVIGELLFSVLKFSTKLAGVDGEFIMNKGDTTISSTAIEYDGGETVDMLAKFKENDAGTYAFTYNEDESVDIVVTKTGYSWAYFYNEYSGIPTGYTLLTLTLKGSAGTKILVKPDDSVGGDNWYVIQKDNTNETLHIPLTAGVKKILFFVNPNSETDAELSLVSGVISEGVSTKITSGAVLSGYFDTFDKAYTLSEEAGVVTATVDHTGKSGWSFFRVLTSSLHDKGSEDLRLKVTVDGTQGDKILLKPDDASEVWYTLKSDDQEVFYVENDKLKQFTKLINIFLNGNKEPAATSTMSIKIEVEKAPKEQTKVVYTAGDVTVDANGYWLDGGNSAYTFVKNADNSYTVTVNKVNNQYALFKNEYEGFAEAAFTHMTLVVKGTAGQQLAVKPNDNGAFEQYINFTGEWQTVSFAIPAGMTKMIFFFQINDASATGEFTIYNLIMHGAMEAITGYVADTNQPSYTFSEANGITTVVYDKTSAWSWFKVEPLNIKAGSELALFIKGKAGDVLKLKPNDNGAFESDVTLTGEWQAVVIKKVPAEFVKIFLFINGGVETGTGEFQFKLVALNSLAQPDTNKWSGAISPNNYAFNVNKYWATNPAEPFYNIVEDEGKFNVSVAVEKGHWSWFQTKFADLGENFSYLKLTVKGTAGKTLLVKPNDNGAFEITITFTGDEQVEYVAIPKDMVKVIIFYAPGAQITASESFTILNAELVSGVIVSEDAYVTNFSTHETSTVSVDENKVSIVYTSGAWKFVPAYVNGSTAGLGLKVKVLSSVDSVKLLVKLNNSNTFETWMTLAESTEVIISGSKLPADVTSILLFPDGGETVDGERSMVVSLQWVELPV